MGEIHMSKDKQIHIRVTDEEKEKIEKHSKLMGFKQTSEYLRFLGLCKPKLFELDIDDNNLENGKITLESGK